MKQDSEIEKEINKQFRFEYVCEDLVVHRSFSGVIVASSRQGSYRKYRGGNSFSGHAFDTVEGISRVTPIIKKIKDNYFNEKITEKYINLEDDANKAVLKRVQNSTKKHEDNLEKFRVDKDSDKYPLREAINKSTNRLIRSRYGKRNPKIQESLSVPNEPVVVSAGEKPNLANTRAWQMIKKREREKSFEERLRFYQESPRTAKRRLTTHHLPWNIPRIPEITSTPENSRYYPKTQRKPIHQNSFKKQFTGARRPTLAISYLRHPELLGSEGTSLLLQIVSDERGGYKTTYSEIEKFNSIVNKRLSLKEENSYKQGIKEYALKKLYNLPAPKAEAMITDFFALSF